RPQLLPDARGTAHRWRNAFRDRGLGEIFLVGLQTGENRTSPEARGFDAEIQFPPHASCLPVNGLLKDLRRDFSGKIYDYNRTKRDFIDEFVQLNSSRRIYPCVMPSWDNTARSGNKSLIWINSSPESYYDWLSQVIGFLRRTRERDDRLVFINAWNEWAEGCHLEPDQQFGHAWLNATKLAVQRSKTVEKVPNPLHETNGGIRDDSENSVRDAAKPNAFSYNSAPGRHRSAFSGMNNHEPLTVLFISHDAHPAGAQKLLLTLTSWLKEK